MKTYLVGGAVRDKLLGLPVRERDWVVVGATPQDMADRGFKPVGKDFPVFLHPRTKEEYALARTERKTAPGYHGFVFHADPNVTLEEDLRRRDLTVNAIAQDENGTLIDPFGGRGDLERRCLRHVSHAFAEDPVRILRLARFAARFQRLGFTVAEETLSVCRAMTTAGEADALVAERVWQEMLRALGEPAPGAFIQVLRDCGALARLFPEIDRLFGVPQRADYHPEIDTGVHTMMVLEQAARLSEDPVVRFAALLHDLGKGTTPREEWPRHRGHEARGKKLVDALCARLKTPRHFHEVARQVAAHHLLCHQAFELRPATILDLLEHLGSLRRNERLEQFLMACEADARGRAGFEERAYPQADFLRGAYRAAADVIAKPFLEKGLEGKAVGEALRKARIAAIRAQKERFFPEPPQAE